MKIIRWAAVAVTALFVLMNAGAAFDPGQPAWARIVGAVLGAAGLVAALGLAVNRSWGWVLVVAVGVLNCLGAVAALVLGGGGFAPGLVVGGLAVLLGLLARPTVRKPAVSH